MKIELDGPSMMATLDDGTSLVRELASLCRPAIDAALKRGADAGKLIRHVGKCRRCRELLEIRRTAVA